MKVIASYFSFLSIIRFLGRFQLVLKLFTKCHGPVKYTTVRKIFPKATLFPGNIGPKNFDSPTFAFCNKLSQSLF